VSGYINLAFGILYEELKAADKELRGLYCQKVDEEEEPVEPQQENAQETEPEQTTEKAPVKWDPEYGKKLDLKIEHIREEYDEATATILERNKERCREALEELFDEPEKVLWAYEKLLTEIRYVLHKDVELGRYLAGILPDSIDHSWKNSFRNYQKLVDKLVRRIGG